MQNSSGSDEEKSGSQVCHIGVFDHAITKMDVNSIENKAQNGGCFDQSPSMKRAFIGLYLLISIVVLCVLWNENALESNGNEAPHRCEYDN